MIKRTFISVMAGLALLFPLREGVADMADNNTVDTKALCNLRAALKEEVAGSSADPQQAARVAEHNSVGALLRDAVSLAATRPEAPPHLRQLAKDQISLSSMPFNDLAERILDPKKASEPFRGPRVDRIEGQHALVRADQEPVRAELAQKICTFVQKGGLRGGPK